MGLRCHHKLVSAGARLIWPLGQFRRSRWFSLDLHLLRDSDVLYTDHFPKHDHIHHGRCLWWGSRRLEHVLAANQTWDGERLCMLNIRKPEWQSKWKTLPFRRDSCRSWLRGARLLGRQAYHAKEKLWKGYRSTPRYHWEKIRSFVYIGQRLKALGWSLIKIGFWLDLSRANRG